VALPVVAALLRAALATATRVLPRALGGEAAKRAASKLARSAAGKKAWATRRARDAVGEAVHDATGELGHAAEQATQAASKTTPVDVVENSAAKTARDLSRQLAGEHPPAPTAAQMPQGTGPAPPPSHSGGGVPGSTPAPSASPGTPSGGSAGNASAPPGASPPTGVVPPPVASPPAGVVPPPVAAPGPPAVPAPPQSSGGWLDGLQSKMSQARDAYDQWRNQSRSVADQTKGMSLDDRYDRLKKAKNLLTPNDAGRQLGTPMPTREQIVQASENTEEVNRKRAAEEAAKPAWDSKRLIGHAVVGLPSAASSVVQALEVMARRVSESNRHLARFNGHLAASYAARDVAQLRADFKTAQGTAGSGAFLNTQLAKLIEEVQPTKEAVIRILNTIAGVGVVLARGINLMVRVHPMFQVLKLIGEKIEENTKPKAADNNAQLAHQRMLRDLVANIHKPLNPPPRRK